MLAIQSLSTMSLGLVIASLLSTGAQAFAPAPIRWGGAVEKRFVIAPASSGSESMSEVQNPQRLTIRDQTGVIDDTEIAYFTAKPDNTIAWDTKGLCIEATGAATGDGIQLNRCTGEPTQTWNWLPWGPLQLHGTNHCLDVVDNAGLNGAPIEMRECDGATNSWTFEEPVPTPVSKPSSYFESLHQVMISLTALALLVFFALSAHLCRLQQKLGAFVPSQGWQPDGGGLCLTAPSVRDSTAPMTPSAQENAQKLVPAVMAVSPGIHVEGAEKVLKDECAPHPTMKPQLAPLSRRAVGQGLFAATAGGILAPRSALASFFGLFPSPEELAVTDIATIQNRVQELIKEVAEIDRLRSKKMKADDTDDAYVLRWTRAVLEPLPDLLATIVPALKSSRAKELTAEIAESTARLDEAAIQKASDQQLVAAQELEREIGEVLAMAKELKFDTKGEDDINLWTQGTGILYNKFLFRAGTQDGN